VVDRISSGSLCIRRSDIYAIVEAGGKQYKVTPGQVIDVDGMGVEGDTVELERVYLVSDGDNVSVGRPTVEGAKVIADVLDEGRAKKVLVFKYKPKIRYRRKKGHRQPYTRLAIKEIVAG
jgi:large subunit ribosomal protein L21